MAHHISQPGQLEQFLPDSLTEIYKAELELINGGRPEKVTYLQKRINTELKLISQWLKLVPPPPLDARFTGQQSEDAYKWFEKLRSSQENALTRAKAQKSDKENELKLREAVPLLRQQQVEDQIAKLKDLDNQRETLKTKIEKLTTDIKEVNEQGMSDLVKVYEEEKSATQTELDGLDETEEEISTEVCTVLNNWRKKHKELEGKVNDPGGLVELAIKVAQYTKVLEYLDNYKADIINQWLNNNYPAQSASGNLGG